MSDLPNDQTVTYKFNDNGTTDVEFKNLTEKQVRWLNARFSLHSPIRAIGDNFQRVYESLGQYIFFHDEWKDGGIRLAEFKARFPDKF